MQRTCRWEPWCGTTAQATDTAVAECTGQPDKQLHPIFETYRVTLPGSRKEAGAARPGPPRVTAMVPGAYVVQPGPSASAPVPAEVDDTTTTGPSVAQLGPSRTLQHLCTKYQITAFQRPFYLLMIMRLLPVQWVTTRSSCCERLGPQPGVEAKSSTPCFLTGSASCQRALLMRGGTLEISATTRAAKRMKCLLAFCFTASSVTAFCKSGARTSLLKCNDQFFNYSVSATSSAN